MEQYSDVKSWSEISGRDDVRALYADDASTPGQLPFSVRDVLGDFLCNAEFNESNAQQKGAFLAQLQTTLANGADEVAREEFQAFTKLGLMVEGKKKPHTKTSLYASIMAVVEAERRLTEISHMDVDEANSDSSSSSSSASDSPQPEASNSSPISSQPPPIEPTPPVQAEQQEDHMDEDVPVIATEDPPPMPACTQKLFAILQGART